jgi:hypothetical protein
MWFFNEETSQTPKDFKLATPRHHFAVPFHAARAHKALADVLATVGLYREAKEDCA